MRKLKGLIGLVISYYHKCLLSKTNAYVIGKNTIALSKIRDKGRNNSISIGHNCSFRNLRIEINGDNNTINISNNVKVYESLKILIEKNFCEVELMSNTTMGSAQLQLGESDTKIIIGEDCMLSRNIMINTSDFHSIIERETNTRINKAKNVIIGNHVWLGNGVYITKGANIGNNVVVAARSVVTSSKIKDNVVAAGVPARIIKIGTNWDRKLL